MLADDQRRDTGNMRCGHAGARGPTVARGAGGRTEDHVPHPARTHDALERAVLGAGIVVVAARCAEMDRRLSIVAVAGADVEVSAGGILQPGQRAQGADGDDARQLAGERAQVHRGAGAIGIADTSAVVIQVTAIIAGRRDHGGILLVGVPHGARGRVDEFRHFAATHLQTAVHAEAHVDDVRAGVRGMHDALDDGGERAAARDRVQHLHRDQLRFGCDADRADAVVRCADGAHHVRAVRTATGVAVGLAGHERCRLGGVEVGDDVQVRAVHAGIQYRDGRTAPPVTRVPGTCCIDGRVAPLEVEEAVVVAGCRRVRIGGGDLFRRGRQVVLDRHVGDGRAHRGNAACVRAERRVVGFHDRHADLRQARHDAAACGFDAARELVVETVAVRGHHIGGGVRRTGARECCDGESKGLGKSVHAASPGNGRGTRHRRACIHSSHSESSCLPRREIIRPASTHSADPVRRRMQQEALQRRSVLPQARRGGLIARRCSMFDWANPRTYCEMTRRLHA